MKDEQTNDELRKEIFKLKEEYHLRQAIESSMQAGVAVINMEGKQSYVNSFFCKMVDWLNEDLIDKKSPFIYWPSSEIEKINTAFQLTLQGKAPKSGFELKFIRRNGELFDVLVNLSELKNFENEIIGWLAVVNDITERKQSEQALQLENERFVTVMNSLNAIVYVADFETDELLFINKYFVDTFGDGLGKKCYSILQENQTEKCSFCTNHILLDKSRNFSEPYIWEFQNTITQKWYYIHDSKIRWLDGRFVRLEIATDITERKIAEQKLKENANQLKKINSTKDKLFSIIAHDLRNPFGSIIGFSDLLLKNIKKYDIEKIEKYVEQINSTSKSTLVLLDNLLIWARSQTGQIVYIPKILRIKPIINEVIEILKSSADIKNITVNYNQSNVEEIYADQNMLHTILRNLISNAIKFTKQNGKIFITVLSTKNHVEISVSDNGIGMNVKTKENLFTLGKIETTLGTNDESGTGLGLYLCKDFVQKHNGKIWVESEIEKGSDFRFTIPNN